MFGMMKSDAYLYLYASAIRAGCSDPEAVARKGADDFAQYDEEQREARRHAEGRPGPV